MTAKITSEQNDLVTCGAECVVNPANSWLQHEAIARARAIRAVVAAQWGAAALWLETMASVVGGIEDLMGRFADNPVPEDDPYVLDLLSAVDIVDGVT